MKNVIIALFLLLITNSATSQTTAMNFNRMDCNGNMQNLFSDLDNEKVVILEFFMINCASCINAGNVLESMKAHLLTQYPGKIKSYSIGFNNTYSCTQVTNWVTANGFSSIPMDSGAAQVAYYGGFGMPSIVILGDGNKHNILGSPYLAFTKSDTTTMAQWIRNSLNVLAGVKEENKLLKQLNVFPNPASSEFQISFLLTENSKVSLDVMDVSGRVVATLLNEELHAGSFVKTFNTSLANGNYFLRINANGIVTQHKLNIIR